MMICSGNGNTKTDHGEILELSFSLNRTLISITMAQLECLAKYLENSTCEGEYKLQQFRQGEVVPCQW